MKLALFALMACSVRGEVTCIVVDQSSVTAGELATAIPELRTIVANRHLVWAPAPGLTRWLRATELRAIAAREGVPVAAPTSICLQRRTVVFSEEQVLIALRERLPPDSEIRVVDYCRVPVISGRLRFESRPAALPTKGNPNIRWRGTVIGDDRKTSPFWASVQIRINRLVVRAARAIPAKAILNREDLLEVSEQSNSFEAGPPPELSSLLGKEITRSVAPNEVISPSWLRTPQLISRGQTVRVIVESGQALLGFDARALTGGGKGDTLFLINDGTGKKLRAEVTGPGTAKLRMETHSK